LYKWSDLVRLERKTDEKKKLMARVLGHLARRKKTMCWNQWTSVVTTTKQHEEMRKLRHSRAARTLIHITKTWSHRELARSFNSWKQIIDIENHAHGLLSRVIGRLTHRQTAAAFRRWREFVQIIANRYRTMRRIVKRLQHTLLSAAMRSWKRGTLRSREYDILQIKKRQIIHSLLGKKHISRVATLRLAFSKFKSGCSIVSANTFYREQFKTLKRELYLIQCDNAASRLSSIVSKFLHRKLSRGFRTLVDNTVGIHDLMKRRSRLLRFFVMKTERLTKRTAFDAIRRQAMLHTRLRLDRLEQFLSKEKSDNVRYGMRTFLTLVMKTMQSREKLHKLRAFNKIFQYVCLFLCFLSLSPHLNSLSLSITHTHTHTHTYRYGMGLLHERHRFMKSKHDEVLQIVRRLRNEIVKGEEEEEPQKSEKYPRTPPRHSPVSPRFRERSHKYRSHHEPSPPPIPRSAVLERQGFAARQMFDTTKSVVERWLLRSAFTTWNKCFASVPRTRSPASSKINIDTPRRDRNPWNSYDYSTQFSSWKDAARRIRSSRS